MDNFEIEVEGKSPVEARIESLRFLIEDARAELRQLVREQEKAEAQAQWEQKVGDLNEAQLEALEEALKARAAKSQVLGIVGIESKEVVSTPEM